MHRHARAAAPIVAVLLAAVPATGAASEIAVQLALSQEFYYEGDPLEIRISVQNLGDQKVENPIKTPLFDGFRVRRDGQPLERTGRSSTEEPSRPAELARDSFYGAVVDLVELYPDLARRGTYEIHWAAGSLLSHMLVVTVLPRYDPERSYRAEIETELGSIVIDLFGDASPIAVKAFIDLANSGYYDRMLVSEVRADDYIVAGDPRFGELTRRPIQFPAEPSALRLVSGTVVLRPVRASPPTNGPAFMILLRPQPTWQGQVTVLGQVASGLEVVQGLSRLPSTLRGSEPNFKPLKDVPIRDVRIHEGAPRAAAP
jgi:cyclophilin family peptidyl-prolyl cis-trans isomerase